MPRLLLRPASFIAGLLSACLLQAQGQLDNPSFETWSNANQSNQEPTDWSSLKTSDGGTFINNLVPQLCWRSSDAHTGNYSVNLRTVSSIAGDANGLLTNGRVHAEFNIANSYMYTIQDEPQWNTAVTGRPDSIVGWFKASPEAGDRPNLGALLHVDEGRLPAFGTEGNYVAGASWKGPYAQVSEWTRFSAPFQYLNDTEPEWILFILTAGDSAGSQVGTQVWYDDLALIYNLQCTPSVELATVSSTDGFAFDVDYSTGGNPVTSTTFSVELSDSDGGFDNPIVIGSVISTAASGTIPCLVPAGTAPGVGYRIRVSTPSAFYAPVGCGIAVELLTSMGEDLRGEVRLTGTLEGIRVDLGAPAVYECFDAHGRAIATGVLRPGTDRIELADRRGMVLVRILVEGTVYTQRVVLP